MAVAPLESKSRQNYHSASSDICFFPFSKNYNIYTSIIWGLVSNSTPLTAKFGLRGESLSNNNLLLKSRPRVFANLD